MKPITHTLVVAIQRHLLRGQLPVRIYLGFKEWDRFTSELRPDAATLGIDLDPRLNQPVVWQRCQVVPVALPEWQSVETANSILRADEAAMEIDRLQTELDLLKAAYREVSESYEKNAELGMLLQANLCNVVKLLQENGIPVPQETLDLTAPEVEE